MLTQQRWRSLGHVHVAGGESPAHATHASYPTPLVLTDGRVRVFFSPRDVSNRSSIFSIDLELSVDGFSSLGPPVGPWLEPGSAGMFDDAGASVGWVGAQPDGGIDCWYLGWSLGVSVPFRTAIGRAAAAPNESKMTRCSVAPVLDRHEIDPLSLGYPWIVREADQLILYYGTHRWPPHEGREIDHVIRRASARKTGVAWDRDTVPALAPEGPGEWGLSRPSVIRDASGWHMWFARRRLDRYSLGYAHSPDGVRWTRLDDAVDFVGPEAPWEQGSRTYPAVFDHQDRRWMLYNGNSYGRTGFGVAILDDNG